MSITIRADFKGEIVIGVVVVCRVILSSADRVEDPVFGEDRRVRSKPVCEECSQKFGLEPIMALRCGSVGNVEDESMAMID